MKVLLITKRMFSQAASDGEFRLCIKIGQRKTPERLFRRCHICGSAAGFYRFRTMRNLDGAVEI